MMQFLLNFYCSFLNTHTQENNNDALKNSLSLSPTDTIKQVGQIGNSEAANTMKAL